MKRLGSEIRENYEDREAPNGEKYPCMAKEENLPEMIKGSDVVVDGLDDISARFAVQRASKAQGIP